MKPYQLFVFVFILLLISTYLCTSQVDTSKVLRDTSITNIVLTDSLAYKDTTAVSESYKMTKSPWLAVGLSAVVPGSGQIYNENYWKAPLVWGVGGYWVYEWIYLNKRYKEFRDKYNESLNGPIQGDLQYQRDYKGLRDYYHDERDKFAWLLGALYLLNLVDAYVGANLYDFNVSPDLSSDGKIIPRVTATIRFRF